MLHSSICVFTSDAYVKFHVWRRKNKVSDCVKHPVMMQAVLFIILYPAANCYITKAGLCVPDDVADDSCLVCKEGV